MSIASRCRTSSPNSCSKSVLQIVRLDFSFASYTGTFCLTMLTLILIKLSLRLFLYCMRVFKVSTMSVLEEYSPGSTTVGLFCFGGVYIETHKFAVCKVLVHWWVRNFGNFYLPLSLQIHPLRWKKFVRELSVWFGLSCYDALETKSIVNEFVLQWLLSFPSPKTSHV